MNRRTFASSSLGWFASIMGIPWGFAAEGQGNNKKPKRTITGFHNGFEVPAGETLEVVGTCESDANVVVWGTLVMRPGSTLRFVNVDERNYVGGGMNVVDSDVGLWVMGDGVLDVRGTPKTGWNRTGWDASWASSDELVVTPTDPGDFDTFAPFPLAGVPPTVGGKWSAEVLNLSRDVLIEGTPRGRACILIRSTKPQTIKHCVIRHMGPRQNTNTYHSGLDRYITAGVGGRVGLHFHHCGEGSRGTIVEGVVIRDTGSHAFQPHVSHGITLRDCISYNTWDDAYWWNKGDETNDLLIDGCVAAFVQADPPFRGYRLTGFALGRGRGNRVQNSVAVGIQGTNNSSGFTWPQWSNNAPNVWTFTNNLAHNNKANGIFVWQNTKSVHPVENFVAYRCGRFGVEHGAYSTPFYHYRNLELYENVEGGILQHAQNAFGGVDRPDGYGFSFENVIITGGLCGVVHTKHTFAAAVPLLFKGITFANQMIAKIRVQEGETNPGLYDFVDCNLEPNDVQIIGMVPGSRIRAQRRDNSAWSLEADGVARTIPAFYNG